MGDAPRYPPWQCCSEDKSAVLVPPLPSLTPSGFPVKERVIPAAAPLTACRGPVPCLAPECLYTQQCQSHPLCSRELV